MQTMQITVHVFYFHKCVKNDKWKKWNISQCSSLQKLTILKMRIFIVFFQLSSLHSLPFFLSHCHSITSPFCNFFMLFPICMSSTLQENQFYGNGLNQLCMQFHDQRVMGGDWPALCSSMAARGHFWNASSLLLIPRRSEVQLLHIR